ncbi:hypothetical protein TPHA_0G00510 [Tetrapisispora phaffii CBS 4417]|uniref:AMMECR1 domain-containing protein n=1 Tax=Tetrapisispora phaffii (strain ATCC 24235 / CBS 4417 / NBRC 1672 / NRRL Y-8282 / UCD 70-5) TaxID=1071381 RepID=G8BVF9_TETPH|nr:hypothetical protein TPHA_0G00510 [Tetrapisispora phaffii CBS 4417]CCE63887.1 hypothetical protein TPHA_0G00510 [Tetrapisispora phaffii CBS 4417]
MSSVGLDEGSPYVLFSMWTLYHYFRNPSEEYNAKQCKEIFNKICLNAYPNYRLLDHSVPKSLFITWKKKKKRSLPFSNDDDYALRGCIGTFAKLPLLEGIYKYTLIAALEDSRFPSIEEKELPRLKCTCNILHSFTTIYSNKSNHKNGNINDWIIGKHGIELKYRDPISKSIVSATFLPEVMKEQGWDKHTTFEYLIEKAGCLTNISTVLDNYEKYFVEVIRYEGMESSMDYHAFQKYLDHLESALE